ncbi:MAG: UDP-3-O-acyl-N-acetylglucosamine deacetylase [Armatimonadetes bacterium]|nr:UDP-3-O-acyl-N-acetylglucosamine deacetylase [Armatimonadota bacterium]
MAAVFNTNARVLLENESEPLDALCLQKTLAGSVRLSGTGLHSGGDTSVVIRPAPENTGVVFSDGTHIIRGLASNVVDTSRGTSIGFNGTRIRTIEHLMAALRGSGVDNAVVEVIGPELPALDGSALPYVEAIDAVGLIDLASTRKPIVLTEPVCVRQNGSFVLAVPAPRLSITYVLSYDHPLIGSQTATYVLEESDFGSELAPARTFVLYEEVEGLLNDGLSQGGSLDNVIVIWQDRMSSELRFEDELARHKVVDLIGDLALVGGLLQAEILAVKSGHALNVEFARAVSHSIAECRMQNAECRMKGDVRRKVRT